MRVPSQDTAGNFFIFAVDLLVGTTWEWLCNAVACLVPAPVPVSQPRYRGGRRRRRGYSGGGQLVAFQETTTTRTVVMGGHISRDPSAYQERRGLKPTRRLPEPRLYLGDNPINTLPLAPPNPMPELMLPVVQPASPDTGKVGPWPVPGS